MLPDLASLEYFHFLRPAWGLLLFPWLFVHYMMKSMEPGRDRFSGIIAPHLLEHLRINRFRNRWANPRNLSRILFALFLIILMGPSWRQQPSPLIQDEAALVILLDASASMSQRDIQPSRLARAKQKAGDLLALRPDKQAALVAYAGSAHTVLSLTSDQAVLGQYLAAIEPEIMPRPGKFPEYALTRVDDILRQSSSPATIVLLTDGLGANSEEAFARYFDSKPHQLIVLGIGGDGEDDGSIPLERKGLRALASRSGGKYFDLTIDATDVKRIDRLVESHYLVVEDSALPWLDSGYVLVFPAMALFLMWFRRGWTITWVWLLLPLTLFNHSPPVLAGDQPSESHWFADLWLTPDQQGRLLLQRGDYPEAAKRFDNPMWKGLAYYYSEEFMLAAEYFSRSDSDDALFNEANARAQARDYVRAVARYDRLLARTPNYPGAAANRQQVQAIIDETNLLSESQQAEGGVSSEELDPAGDQPVPAQGAEEKQLREAKIARLNAAEILQDPATRDMWLRGVQHDPADFLAIKFTMQLTRSAPATGSEERPQ